MSKYREIKTEYRNLESLKKALSDMGVPYEVSPNWRTPDLSLYGYHNDERPEKASLAIRKDWLNQHWSGQTTNGNYYNGISNDLGFAWDGKQFVAIVSQYDSTRQGVTDALKQLNQRYSFHEVQRLARANGYLVKSSTSQDGQIRLVVQKVG
jgi:hypothetical protein